MKVAISSTGPNLDAPVDSRFGRCQYFLLVDPDTEAFESLSNEAAMLSGGAGIQAAQLVAGSGAGAVITGHLGPNAADTLAAAGLKVYLGSAGTVRQTLQQYRDGQLREAAGPTVEAHSGTNIQAGGRGMNMGRGMGRGMGKGQGMGRGMGRGQGMGIGMRRGVGMGQGSWFDLQEPLANGLEELKDQKDKLQEQMKRIEERISNLEKKK